MVDYKIIKFSPIENIIQIINKDSDICKYESEIYIDCSHYIIRNNNVEYIKHEDTYKWEPNLLIIPILDISIDVILFFDRFIRIDSIYVNGYNYNFIEYMHNKYKYATIYIHNDSKDISNYLINKFNNVKICNDFSDIKCDVYEDDDLFDYFTINDLNRLKKQFKYICSYNVVNRK